MTWSPGTVATVVARVRQKVAGAFVCGSAALKERLIRQPFPVEKTERLSVWIVEDDERFGKQLAELIDLSNVFICEKVFRACEPALFRPHIRE